MPFVTRHLDDLDQPINPDEWQLAVVIDVIRAFTAAPWVLRRGAAHLFLAPDATTALHARDERFPDAVLMKDGRPDPRFPLPNSPGMVSRTDLTGRTVIQATGNGTRGAHAVRTVPTVLCASFATAAATARVMSRHDRVLLVPTEGDEDHALADHLVRTVVDGLSPDPSQYLHRVRVSAAGRECVERAADPAHPGVDPDDLALCLTIDAFDHALSLQPDGDLLRVVPVRPPAGPAA